jgi:uncharacterized lipoprotein YbaY
MRLKALAFTVVLAITAAPASAQVIISLLLGDKRNSGQVEFGLEGGVTYSWRTATPPNSKLQIPNSKLQIPDSWLQVSGLSFGAWDLALEIYPVAIQGIDR